MQLPRLRFSLFSLLTVLTVFAVLLVLLPSCREYRDRKVTEKILRQLKVGVQGEFPDYTIVRNGLVSNPRRIQFFDAQRTPVYAIQFKYDRYWYCVYAQYRMPTREEIMAFAIDDETRVKCVQRRSPYFLQLQVYRLRARPVGYRPQSYAGKRKVMRFGDPSQLVERTPDDAYFTDFLEMLAGRVSFDLGIDYELIHSDPPFREAESRGQ
jgi:hypothetical protein